MDTSTRQTSVLRRWYSIGIANFVIVTVLSFVTWWLLADPQWSHFALYPMPFNAVLFWALLFIVFVGFNCDFSGLNRLSQLSRAAVLIASTAVFSIAMTVVLAFGLGSLMPDFAASRPDGNGYLTGALFVLFGFFTYIMAAMNWQHWPWPQLGLGQPFAGLCDIAFVFIPTLALYVIWGIPSLAVHPTGNALMTVNVVLGYFYALVVATILTGVATENWPWAKAKRPGRVVALSIAGNIALGTVIYFVLLGVCELVIGSGTRDLLGESIHQFPAQLGVCWNFWIILWANGFGNWPNGRRRVANFVTRAAVTFVLGLLTFIVYYYWAAEHILHEPALAGNLHGNALGFIDWGILWILFYVIGSGSYGLPDSVEPAGEMPVTDSETSDATLIEGDALPDRAAGGASG